MTDLTAPYKQPLKLECFEHNTYQLLAILSRFINGDLDLKYIPHEVGHDKWRKGSDCDITWIKQYTEPTVVTQYEQVGDIHCEEGDIHIVFSNRYFPSKYHHLDCFPMGKYNMVVLYIWIKKGQNLFDCICDAVDDIDWIPDDTEGQEFVHHKYFGKGFKKDQAGERHHDFFTEIMV